jgi:hypothetical protein
MVLTEPRRSAHGQDVFDLRAGLKLSANNLRLAVDAAEGRDNEQGNTFAESGGLEIAPSARSGGNQQVIFPVGPYFCNFKAGRFLALAQAASRQVLT